MNDVDIVRPAFLGTEGLNLDKSDFVTPYAKIDKDTGVITNSLSGEVLPDIFIPLKFSRRYAKFTGMKLEWQTTEPTPEQLAECCFGPNGEKPKADKTINALVLFQGFDIPVVITFKRTSYNAGRTLLTMACTGITKSIFEKKFSLSSELVQKTYKYFTYKVKAAGKCSQDEYDTAAYLFNAFKDHSMEVDITDDENENGF